MKLTTVLITMALLQGVGNNKIMRMSLPGGEHIKTWRYSTMKVPNNKSNINLKLN